MSGGLGGAGRGVEEAASTSTNDTSTARAMLPYVPQKRRFTRREHGSLDESDNHDGRACAALERGFESRLRVVESQVYLSVSSIERDLFQSWLQSLIHRHETEIRSTHDRLMPQGTKSPPCIDSLTHTLSANVNTATWRLARLLSGYRDEPPSQPKHEQAQQGASTDQQAILGGTVQVPGCPLDPNCRVASCRPLLWLLLPPSFHADKRVS